MSNIQSVYQIFERSFPDGALQFPSTDKYGEYDSINLTTRYLSSRKDDPITPALPIPTYIDPHNSLSAIDKTRYFYGPENEVQYFHFSDTDIIR